MHPLTWSDLPGRRVVLYGLGTEGRANLRACLDRGVTPVLVDDAPPADDPDLTGLTVLGTAEGGREALLAADVVVKSPGIPLYTPLLDQVRAAGVRVVGGLALWLAGADRDRVLTITGSKGKSTTTAITGHLLSGLGFRTFTGGNLGLPPQDPAAGSDYDYWVVEVSSYQAAQVERGSAVAAVTSLSPDHLPWHGGDPEVYFRDKLSLTRTARVTVANGEDDKLRARADQLGGEVRWVGDDPSATWTEGLGLLGRHNRINALLAREALRAMGVPGTDDDAALTAAAAGFAGLESRLSTVAEVGGVRFVDDGLSTNVLPVLAAVDCFPDQPVALLVGGFSRGIDYRPLGEGLAGRTSPLRVFPMPDNGADIARAVSEANPGPLVTVAPVAELADAVAQAHRWVGPGGVVLLSPAAPSFGHFHDYRDRGRAFADAARSLQP